MVMYIKLINFKMVTERSHYDEQITSLMKDDEYSYSTIQSNKLFILISSNNFYTNLF